MKFWRHFSLKNAKSKCTKIKSHQFESSLDESEYIWKSAVDYDVYFVLAMYNTISFVSFKIKFQNVELLTFIVLCTVASSFYTL